MRELKLNLHFDGSITFGESAGVTREGVVTLIHTVSDLEKEFPNVVCNLEYPPTMKFFEVPFKLSNEVH